MTEARMEDLKNQVESLNIELEHSRANANTLQVSNLYCMLAKLKP